MKGKLARSWMPFFAGLLIMGIAWLCYNHYTGTDPPSTKYQQGDILFHSDKIIIITDILQQEYDRGPPEDFYCFVTSSQSTGKMHVGSIRVSEWDKINMVVADQDDKQAFYELSYNAKSEAWLWLKHYNDMQSLALMKLLSYNHYHPRMNK